MMKMTASMTALAICLGTFVTAPASAQSSTAPSSLDDVSLHHQLLYQMMKDMAQEMVRMTEQMSRGKLTPEQRKQMAKRMRFMSTVMRRMSGLEGRSAMSESDWQKQMKRMRKQMDEMTRDPQMAPSAR